ncbi:DgyrCDS9988 [Dimorphilus gyrociliatus]|uniref:DgyrCDS9988 n=1 Tax=Dimorphilus gyrociliatus TaxID=2664684 RepID=A0A7I8W0X3_9ANNE|nr:DgyrCDS9988 [Dimorphilus gyrociliatus]
MTQFRHQNIDLNILYTPDKKELYKRVERAVNLGYDAVAINYFVENIIQEKKSKKPKPTVVNPENIKLNKDDVKKLQEICPHFTQYTRCTWILSDPAAAHFAQTHKEVQAYDIQAVLPTNEKVLHMACNQLEVDIISLDLTESLGFHFKRTSIGVAIRRGLHFEIIYTPMINDHFSRVNIICNAQSLISICKNKNIILSSACDNIMLLRAPADVSNLCCLFDMNQSYRKATVGKNCLNVLSRAETRKTAKGVIMIQKISDLKKHQRHLIPDSSSDSDVVDLNSDKDEESSSDEELICKKAKAE